MGEPTLSTVLEAINAAREELAVMKHRLDVLVVALATEEEDLGDEPAQTLDGQSAGGERDPNQTL